MSLTDDLGSLAEDSDFSGVVAVTSRGVRDFELVRGLAHRALRQRIRIGTRFGVASATKGLTALTVASLVESGHLKLGTTLRSLVGDALPDVDERVTIEHLLGHTSGVGDYLDEETLGDIDDHVLDLPAHRLATPADYLPLLVGRPQRSSPGERFGYNNSGYVMLSLAAEAAAGRSFYDLVSERVLDPAGMTSTGFYRSDDLPADASLGYLANGRTNVFHLPVRGAGDGGVYTNVSDIESLWTSMFAGRIVSTGMGETLVEARSETPMDRHWYGLGFWLLPEVGVVALEGMDAGVSFRTATHRVTGTTYTVISNTSRGVWPLSRRLDEHLAALDA